MLHDNYIIKNKYYKWYYSIIEIAKNRILENTPTEKHHIIPKSLGGGNESSNIVPLTLREHYVCHKLLTKFYTDIARTKMVYAFWNLTVVKRDNLPRFTRSYDYESCRKLYIETITGRKLSEEVKSKMSSAKQKENNSFYGKKHSNETLNKIRQSKLGKPASIETKKKLSEIRQGENNPFFGKKHLPNAIEKMKNSSKPKSREHREKLAKANLGKPGNNRLWYEITFPDGRIDIVHGLTREYCSTHNIDMSTLRSVISGKRDHTKGIKARKLSDFSQV